MFDISAYGFQQCAACGQKAEESCPKHFFPQLFANLGKLFLDQTAAGGFVRVDETGQFTFRLGTEQDVYMIDVMIPLLNRNLIIAADLFKYFPKT